MDTSTIQIRHVWHPQTARWNYSVVDVIDHAIKTADARNYWKVLKNRLKKRDNDIADCCNQLKMKSRDGKSYLTDTADAHIVLQIIRVISDVPIPYVETWIQIKECNIPPHTPNSLMLSKKSFPQVRKIDVGEITKHVNRNRLKQILGLDQYK